MRRGVVMLEVLVGCGLLAVLLAISVKLLSVTAIERRDVLRRSIALEEAANLVERARALPFAEITKERLKEVKVSPQVEQILPGATAGWFVEEEMGEVPGKRVRVEIHWTPLPGRGQAPARLTYWAYPQPKGAAP